MKIKSIMVVSVLVLSFLTLTSVKTLQDNQTFKGVFDGHEDYGYNFIGIDADAEEYTMTFQYIDQSLLKTFNLKSEQLVGSKFNVTYTTKIEIEKDEDGNEDEVETNTIVALKKL